MGICENPETREKRSERKEYKHMMDQIEFCCEDMKNNVNDSQLIHYSETVDEYGIKVWEDNCSSILISFCPWCGKKLPISKREQWFAELEEKGFENPLFDDNIPASYKNGDWWKCKLD